jgi:SAM-dependent methyltransferase
METSNAAPWRHAVGGMWDEIGTLQYRFLSERGLLPQHRFLDIGCGSLRGGIHFIRYLEAGHYYGIDRDQNLLDAGRQFELGLQEFSRRRPTLLCRDDFDFTRFGVEFDYALAQSVFTHLTWNSILRCLVNVKKVLATRGCFLATFFEDMDGTHRLTPLAHEPGGVVTHSDRDPFHYEFSVFVDLARRTALQAQYIGAWNHPRNQKIMVFRHAAVHG